MDHIEAAAEATSPVAREAPAPPPPGAPPPWSAATAPSRGPSVCDPGLAPPLVASRPRRLPWAELLRRVHAIDVRDCPRCHGRLQIIAFLTDPAVTAAILRHLGLPATAPRPAPARGPPGAGSLLDGAGRSDDPFVDPPCPEPCPD